MNRIPQNVSCHAPDLDADGLARLDIIASSPSMAKARIAVMPDAHAAHSSLVGLVAIVDEGGCISPSIVSGDIGCGVLLVPIKKPKKGFNWDAFDKAVSEAVPMGEAIRAKGDEATLDGLGLEGMCCWSALPSRDKFGRYLGTLGGGNHFIEVDADDAGREHWLAIHTGSRNLGTIVYKYWQDKAYASVGERGEKMPDGGDVPYELAWLEGEDAAEYVADAEAVARFAAANRAEIAARILKATGVKEDRSRKRVECIHNYVSSGYGGDDGLAVIRKGAISAQEGECVAIPLDMASGIALGRGLGNDGWLCSASHGTGRAMGRREAKDSVSMSAYRKRMADAGVWSSSVCAETVDESPFAYRDADAVLGRIVDTVEITKVLRPLYNVKAGGK